MRRDVLGDADDGADAGVGGLVDRVGGEPGRYEDQRRVRARLLDRIGDGVEHRNALDVLAGLARRHACDDVRPVLAVAQAVEAALAARQPLDDEARVVVDDDRHRYLWLLRALSTIESKASIPFSVRSASSSRMRPAASGGVSTRSSQASML